MCTHNVGGGTCMCNGPRPDIGRSCATWDTRRTHGQHRLLDIYRSRIPTALALIHD
jgi:hypothetical protein